MLECNMEINLIHRSITEWEWVDILNKVHNNMVLRYLKITVCNNNFIRTKEDLILLNNWVDPTNKIINISISNSNNKMLLEIIHLMLLETKIKINNQIHHINNNLIINIKINPLLNQHHLICFEIYNY